MPAQNVYGLVRDASARYGKAPALYTSASRQADKWNSLNWEEYRQAVEEIAGGLHELGIGLGDVVALLSETRLEFYFADLGIMSCGAVAAAMYCAYPAAESLKTLARCGAKALFVENPKMLVALQTAAGGTLPIPAVLMTGEFEGVITLEQLRARGRALLAKDTSLLDALHQQVKPEHNAILYLTSGATGEPKMGLVTHAAIIANVELTPMAAPLGPDHRTIAFLPSAHITQRMAMQFMPLGVGMAVHFSEGLSRLPHEFKNVRPTFFVAPPRVWERFYSNICTEIRKKDKFTQKLFHGALGIGLDISERRQQGRPVPAWMNIVWKAADATIFKKIRARMGGALWLAISGAAPLGKDLANFFAAIGMPIHEGYGLTEGGIVALNPIGKAKSGSIGKPFPGVEFKIADDGELLIRSETLFLAYFNDPIATAAVLRDGWLHTGDVGQLDADGYYYITGRKKEVIVSSNGKKIYPAMVEGLLKMEALINQVLLVGDKLPYVAALFTLNPAVAEALPGMEEFKGKPLEELVKAPPLLAEVKKLIARVNKQLAPFEQIRRHVIIPRDFTIEAGELTPTMKVRRGKVLENHRDAIQELYLNREDSL